MIDLHSTGVGDWAVSNRLKRDLALQDLSNVVELRSPPPGCIHHTDRGSQHYSNEQQKRSHGLGFKVSQSGKSNCYDNAAVETFFKTLKAELIKRHTWATLEHRTVN
jgi:putative transposase